MFQVLIEDTPLVPVKPEPIDLEREEVGDPDDKTDLHNELGFDDMQNDESYGDIDQSLLGNDDSQNLPGSSGFQGVSIGTGPGIII